MTKRNDLVQIEKMQPEELGEVAELERQIFSEPWSQQGFLDSLKSSDTLYLTARADGRIVGYCGFLQSFDEANITNVAVCEEYRKLGIGFWMLHQLMEQGKKRGIARYTLEVRAGNRAALHLYQKLGFQPAGVRPGFYEKPKEDAVIMWTDENFAGRSQ